MCCKRSALLLVLVCVMCCLIPCACLSCGRAAQGLFVPSAIRSASCLIRVALALKGLCWGSPVCSFPPCCVWVLLVFMKAASKAKASIGEVKSWGWVAGEKEVPFNMRTVTKATSVVGREEKAPVGYWVPKSAVAGVDSKVLMLLL